MNETMAHHEQATVGKELSKSTFSKLREKLDDGNYQRMKSALTATGRGRPTKVEPQPVTVKFLLQLELLRIEEKKCWDEITTFYNKICVHDALQGFSLKGEIEATVRNLEKDENGSDSLDLDAFLAVNIGEAISVRNVGPYLQKHRILRQHLLHPEMLKDLDPPTESCNGVVIDVMLFSKKERLPLTHSRHIMDFFGIAISGLSDPVFFKKLKKTMTKYQSLCKSIKRKNGQENMNIFLDAPAFDQSSSRTPTSCSCSSLSTLHSSSAVAVASAERTSAALRRQLQEVERELAAEKEKNGVLMNQCKSFFKDLQSNKEQLHKSQSKIAAFETEVTKLKGQMKQTKQQLKDIRGTNFYKRLQRKERRLKEKETTLFGHESGECERTAKGLRRKVKLLQTQISHWRAQLKMEREKHQIKTAQFQQTLHNPMHIEAQVEENEKRKHN